MKGLILGVGGQDGSYLADILLERGYEVHGLYRRSSVDNLARISHVRDRIHLHQGDITDPSSVSKAIEASRPHEIYNVADQDHVGWSYATPGVSFDVTAKAVATILEVILHLDKGVRFYQPCSATMFGGEPYPQNEETRHDPQSPYACAKTAAYHVARYYRKIHGMFVSTCILFNHDSPRRSGHYLLHQICDDVMKVATTDKMEIRVGDPDMPVDIGYAREYMEAVVDILQLSEPTDLVLASDSLRTIRQVVEHAMSVMLRNKILSERKYQDYVIVADSSLLRPGPQPTLIGNIRKARGEIGFTSRYNACSMVELLLTARIDTERTF